MPRAKIEPRRYEDRLTLISYQVFSQEDGLDLGFLRCILCVVNMRILQPGERSAI